MDQDSVHIVAASKVSMLKPGEYELWRMRMEQYIPDGFDYSLWEVIENGNAPLITKLVEGVETIIAPSTAKEKAQRSLESVKARLLVYKKNESVYEEDIKLLKREDFILKEVAITELRRKLELALKQKHEIQLTVENFKNSSKSKLLDCQIVDKCKTSLGYNAIPPPYTGNFMPPKPDLSFSVLEEFVNEPIVSEPIVKKPIVESSEAKDSEAKPKIVRKNNGAPLIEDWVSDSEEEDVPQAKIQKKTIKHRNPLQDLQEKGVINNGCSRHMTRNMSYLTNFEEIDGEYVALGGNPKGGKIIGICIIKTGNLDFKNVYFVRELKFNLFSVSQMCDKKNNVLFTDTECIVLSLNFKLTDESHVLLKIPRMNNMYSVDLENIVPKGGLTCLFEKSTSGESKHWHRRLGHINFKTMNKLVKGNLVRGLPLKLFENDQTCVACQKGSNIELLAEAVYTACYVQNRVLVTKPHNKTPYELFLSRKPALGFMRSFGCPATILNTLDHLGKFDGKVDEGFFVRYSMNSKVFRVFNNRTRIVKENLHVQFSENIPNIARSGPNWLFGIDALTKSMNYKPVVAKNQSNGNSSPNAGFKPSRDDAKKVTEELEKEGGDASKEDERDHQESRKIIGCADDPTMPELEEISRFSDAEDDNSGDDMNNLDTYFQMDVKSAFLYKKIEEEVYVCQSPGFEDPDFLDKVYKVEKALYELHQDPRAWNKDDILLVQVYVDAITFGSTKKSLCIEFEKMMHKKFQICFMGELTFFLGLQVKQNKDRIFISQDKYVTEILNKFGFTNVKTASTPMETQKPLLKDEDVLKTTTWNEFSSTMASAIICLAKNQKFNFSKYIFESMVKNLDNVGKFLMYPMFIQVFLEKQLEEVPTHNRIYNAPSHTKKIFGNIKRVGKDFSGRVTPLFPTMMIQNQADTGEDDAINEEMDDSLVRVATTSSSLEREVDSGNITKTRSKATHNEVGSLGTTSGGDPRRQDTIKDTIAQTRFKNVSKTSNDSLLVGVNTPRSDEDRLQLKELMELCTNLQ
ncbi:ribonuclease H-like domain-containing protein [Tanacetum coccineum]